MKGIPFALLAIVLILGISCGHKTTGSARLKARFEIKGLCSNYTFSLLEGRLDSSMVEPSWTNPQTGHTYKNAFGVSNSCDLPADLKEGDEFYFEIIPGEPTQCAVCMAFYPVPGKKLNFKVLAVNPNK